MSEPEPDKMDWLNNIVNDGIAVPWKRWQAGEEGVWSQYEDHFGGWWDTDLDNVDTDKRAFELIDKLESCTSEQLEAITTLLFLAIKTTRKICGDLGSSQHGS